eukprot:TRINITY_DN2306_c0_g1_i1.p1 TRINITY_DN2306_c0_g1~~TRINITY_DN2306_c0_g1_i1.p1  ORF type:complete len:238 (+),score=57.18 TRINITY_DN2306_c0_g1_i1:34-714(+)
MRLPHFPKNGSDEIRAARKEAQQKAQKMKQNMDAKQEKNQKTENNRAQLKQMRKQRHRMYAKQEESAQIEKIVMLYHDKVRRGEEMMENVNGTNVNHSYDKNNVDNEVLESPRFNASRPDSSRSNRSSHSDGRKSKTSDKPSSPRPGSPKVIPNVQKSRIPTARSKFVGKKHSKNDSEAIKNKAAAEERKKMLSRRIHIRRGDIVPEVFAFKISMPKKKHTVWDDN